MSKQLQPAPTAGVHVVGPCPTLIQISRTPRHWKFTQHHRTTRPPDHPLVLQYLSTTNFIVFICQNIFTIAKSCRALYYAYFKYALISYSLFILFSLKELSTTMAYSLPSDHDLVMMTFQVRLKKARKQNQPRLRFNLEKLRDPDMDCTFQATIGGKFAPLIGLSDEDMDMDTMITTYNTAVTDAASEILGTERRRKKAMGHQRCSRPL